MCRFYLLWGIATTSFPADSLHVQPIAANQAELASRIAGVRSETFELVDALRDLDHDRWSELGAAGETMQRIANQLGDVQRLVRQASGS